MNRIVSLSSDLIMSPAKITSNIMVHTPSLTLDQIMTSDPDPDACRTVPELIESRGFIAETYEIPTPDGFILVLHRIINPHVQKLGLDAQPVLLGHGIAAHAGHWLINSDDGYLEPLIDENENEVLRRKSRKGSNNLGFLLANLRYDVWLLNWRGNRYSNRHRKFTTSDPEYWNFTLDDFVEKDLPAFINFVLQKTGKRTLGYVGMSQGSNVMFALLSSQPSFNRKIKPFIALCPAVRINNAIRIPIPWIKSKIPVPDVIKQPVVRLFHYAVTTTGHGPVLNFVDNLATKFTSGTNMLQYYFDNLTYLLSSSFFDLDLDRSRMSVYTAQANFVLSRKNLAHLCQFITYDEFAKFDYGESENESKYGKRDPPEYDLKCITNRTVAIIYSKNDEWASVQDFKSIGTTMKVPLFEDHLIAEPKWSHYDFTFGKNVGSVVNEPVLEILARAAHIPDADLVLEKEY